MHQFCQSELTNQRPRSKARHLHHQEAQTIRCCSQGRSRDLIRLLSRTAHADDLPELTAGNKVFTKVLTIQSAQVIPVKISRTHRSKSIATVSVVPLKQVRTFQTLIQWDCKQLSSRRNDASSSHHIRKQ